MIYIRVKRGDVHSYEECVARVGRSSMLGVEQRASVEESGQIVSYGLLHLWLVCTKYSGRKEVLHMSDKVLKHSGSY